MLQSLCLVLRVKDWEQEWRVVMAMVTLLPWILSDTNINDMAASLLRLLMVKRFIF